MYIGNNDAKNEPFSGDIAEILLYNLPHTTTLRQQIESYLAIKWGITLSQVTPRNYVLNNGTSAGTITAWDATTGGAYKNDIMGLARSDSKSSGGYTLDQRKSKSQNPGTDILTVNTYSNIRLPANNRTIMVAHDG
jgi:hypothetical protein